MDPLAEVQDALDPYFHYLVWLGSDCPPCAKRETHAKQDWEKPLCPVCWAAWERARAPNDP